MSAVRTTLRSAAALNESGLIGDDAIGAIAPVIERYALALTPALAALIDPADPRDPIARQFIPDPRELDPKPEERADPVGDAAHSPVEGVVHRYPDRVLLKLVQVCAVYCRFCFRREMVGPGHAHALSAAALERALDYIRGREEIWEVVLTGGDPLVLSPRRLKDVVQRLSAIDHVKIHRLHTRLPIADPQKITPALVRALKAEGKATYVVVHVNHPRELTAAARAACARFVDAGIPVLSQSVLLRGVNDDAKTLGDLMRALVESRIKPYYLHHGDLAPGTAHLRTSIAQGQALLRALHGRSSGLCQPTYVLDIPGGYGKSPIGPNYLQAAGDASAPNEYEVDDFRGRRHRYPPTA
jgi:lysine 2,3-aminomutase